MNHLDSADRVRLRERPDGTAPVLLIDGAPVRYGRFTDGTFATYEDAYTWSDDLLELGRRLALARDRGHVPARTGQPEGRP